MKDLFDDYLDSIMKHLKSSNRQKREIKKELESHMYELNDSYLSAGLDVNKAVEKVIKDMGSPDFLAEEFNPILKEKRKIKYFRMSVLISCIICIIVITTVSDYKNISLNKYQEFVKGLDNGRITLSEELRGEFYSHDYENNELLMNAINCYYKEKRNYGAVQMVVNEKANVFTTITEVYGLENES